MQVKFVHFPLHPDTPPDGKSLEALFAGRGYDLPKMQAQMRSRMAAEGLPYGERKMTYNSRLVFTWVWQHDKQETLVTLSFRALGKRTEMTLLHQHFANAERRDSHQHGWGGSFERLAELLAGVRRT